MILSHGLTDVPRFARIFENILHQITEERMG